MACVLAFVWITLQAYFQNCHRTSYFRFTHCNGSKERIWPWTLAIPGCRRVSCFHGEYLCVSHSSLINSQNCPDIWQSIDLKVEKRTLKKLVLDVYDENRNYNYTLNFKYMIWSYKLFLLLFFQLCVYRYISIKAGSLVLLLWMTL